eukprot:971659-Pleurochrysis_carterae.AAC.1
MGRETRRLAPATKSPARAERTRTIGAPTSFLNACSALLSNKGGHIRFPPERFQPLPPSPPSPSPPPQTFPPASRSPAPPFLLHPRLLCRKAEYEGVVPFLQRRERA